MIGLQGPIAFIATRDGSAARAFYEGTLGLEVLSDDDFALALVAGGTMIRVQKVERLTPHPFTALGFHIADIGRTLDELRERGVVCERFVGLEQDERGVWTAPSGARIAWFKDPDGNLLSLTELG